MSEVSPILSISWMPQPNCRVDSPAILVAANSQGIIEIFEENTSSELQFLQRDAFRLDSPTPVLSLTWVHSLTPLPKRNERERAACFLEGNCPWDEWSDFPPNDQLLLCHAGDEVVGRRLVHKPIATRKDTSLSTAPISLPLHLEQDSSLVGCFASEDVLCEEKTEHGGCVWIQTLQHGCLQTLVLKQKENSFDLHSSFSSQLGFVHRLVFASLTADNTLTTLTHQNQQLLWRRYVLLLLPCES